MCWSPCEIMAVIRPWFLVIILLNPILHCAASSSSLLLFVGQVKTSLTPPSSYCWVPHNTSPFIKKEQSNKARILFHKLRGGGGNEKRASPVHDDDSLDNKTRSWGISLSLFITYLTVMAAKCALPSTLSIITSTNSDLLHNSAKLSRDDIISRLLALSTLSIAAGKIFLGPVIDSLGGIFSLQIALSTLFLCLGSIGGAQTCPTLSSLAVYWIIVDFGFSSCWAACVKTIREYTEEKRWSKEIGRLAMAARIGNAISFACFSWLLQWSSTRTRTGLGSTLNTSWRWVYRASSAIQLIPLAMLTYFGRRSRSNIATRQLERYKNIENPTTRSSLLSLKILRREAGKAEFWLHLLSRTITMVLVSFLLFIPTFMSQCYEMSSASAARVGSMFALGCLLSVSTLAAKTYPSTNISRTQSHSNRKQSLMIPVYKQKAIFMAIFLALSTGCLTLHMLFLKNIINLSSELGSMIMLVWGFSLAIPFYLPSSMFSLKRGGNEGSATIADAFDVCGFGLLAVFNGFVARIIGVKGGNPSSVLLHHKQAWIPVFSLMLWGSLATMLTLFSAVWLEGKREEINEDDLI